MQGKSLRDQLHMVGSLLWARGLPPPTADEFADRAVKLFEEIEVPVEVIYPEASLWEHGLA